MAATASFPAWRRSSRPRSSWGSHDKLIPPGFGRHVTRWLPNAEQIVLEGCGHVPQIERPERTNGVLTRFLARIDALGAASVERVAA